MTHDVQLEDATRTDLDEVEESGVVHHESCQFLSDASWPWVSEVLSVRSVGFGKSPNVPKVVDFHLLYSSKLDDLYQSRKLPVQCGF